MPSAAPRTIGRTRTRSSGHCCASARVCTQHADICVLLCTLADRAKRPRECSVEGDDVVLTLGVPGPDGLLVVLADAGAGNLVDERPALGEPPANHLVRQEFSKLLRGGP